VCENLVVERLLKEPKPEWREKSGVRKFAGNQDKTDDREKVERPDHTQVKKQLVA